MQSRTSIAALVALAAFAVPTLAQAQKPSPVAPSRLLAQREELELTPVQVRELTLLATQVRRYQQAVLRAPSRPWVARTKGTSMDCSPASAELGGGGGARHPRGRGRCGDLVRRRAQDRQQVEAERRATSWVLRQQCA